MSLPMYTDVNDIEKAINILSSKIKEIPLAEAQKIDKKAFTDNNLETFVFLGLLDSLSSGIKLSDQGRAYANADSDSKKAEILIRIIKRINIYDTTLENMHHNGKLNPTKTEVGAYWNDTFKEKVNDMSEEQISSAVIFFLRLLDKVGLGKFISAGRGRETRIDFDNVILAEYITRKVDRKDITTDAKQPEEKGKNLAIVTNSKIQTETTDTQAVELSPSSLRALGKLEIGLSWKDLDSDGAKKLIIEKLDDLQQENTVLKAKVEKMNDIDKKNAVLEVQNKSLSNMSLIKISVNSIGGIILGASIGFSDISTKVIGISLGVILIALSIFFREKAKPESVEKIEK